jgi:hypothetical protein
LRYLGIRWIYGDDINIERSIVAVSWGSRQHGIDEFSRRPASFSQPDEIG